MPFSTDWPQQVAQPLGLVFPHELDELGLVHARSATPADGQQRYSPTSPPPLLNCLHDV
jgi:hypothetical protein